MRDHVRRMTAASAVMMLVACGGSGSTARRLVNPDEGDLVAEGRRTFMEACAPCHGRSAAGDGPVADSLVRRPADLTRLAARNGGAFPRDLVVDTLTGERPVPAHGLREMPVWCVRFEPAGIAGPAGVYAERRTNALLAYLASIQRRTGE